MSAKILVIDDDANTMMIISSILKSAGYAVVQAYGGDDAIRKAKAQQPSLVLTDLEMPDMTGVEVIATLRKDPATQHIPIVAVTSHTWDVIAQSAGQVGCDGYLAKPFLPKQLIETVRKYLASATPKSS
ncbi:MAG: response regulator [Deltaproteobacteria bacterium]|nr:response regulator [Deltaproteobacteria bacterium]MBI3387904.1 response regulator [Deltaproteobacteria bacterium]